MPVIPSFRNFAPTPDLAGAWLGGRAAAQKDRQIANDENQFAANQAMQGYKLQQDASEAEQAIAMSQQKLQQEAVQSQMEMQARQSQLQQQSLRADQELKIKQQYQQQQIGIKQQQAKMAADTLAIKVKDASIKWEAQNEHQKRMKHLVDVEKMTPQQASSQAMMELAPRLGINASAFNRATVPDGVVQEGYVSDGKGGMRIAREPLEIVNTRRAIKDLENQQADRNESNKAASASIKLGRGEAVAPDFLAAFKAHETRARQIEQLRATLPEFAKLGTNAGSAAPEDGKPVKITSREEYDELPPGTSFEWNGKVYPKKK